MMSDEEVETAKFNGIDQVIEMPIGKAEAQKLLINSGLLKTD